MKEKETSRKDRKAEKEVRRVQPGTHQVLIHVVCRNDISRGKLNSRLFSYKMPNLRQKVHDVCICNNMQLKGTNVMVASRKEVESTRKTASSTEQR